MLRRGICVENGKTLRRTKQENGDCTKKGIPMRKKDNMYQKGIDTRSKIIQSAKKLFYEYGYNKVTVVMIKDRAGVSLSAIPYYFKTKDNIVSVIYNEFLISIYKFLQEIISEEIDSYLFHFYASKIYYYIIFHNEKNNQFYYEVSVAQSNYKLLESTMSKINKNYARDFQIQKTEKQFALIRMCDSGSRREILQNYYNNIIDITKDELIDYITSISGTLIGIDQNISEKYGKRSTEFVKNLDYSSIKFLV